MTSTPPTTPATGALRIAIDALEVLNGRPRPMCRDCADMDGTCPNSGLPCDMRAVIENARAALASAPAAPQPQRSAKKYDDTLLPFLELMRAELHANSAKGDRPGWLTMSREVALLEIYWHTAKLSAAVKNSDGALTREHAADVANMAMMLLDVCGELPGLPQSQGSEPTGACCSECGNTSTDDSMWALYCVECIETKVGPALDQQPQGSEPIDYKAWYEEAIRASNEAGFVGLTAAETIRALAQPAAQQEDAWRERASKWLLAKAKDQEEVNAKYPDHVKAYPSWESRVVQLKWLAEDVLTRPGIASSGGKTP